MSTLARGILASISPPLASNGTPAGHQLPAFQKRPPRENLDPEDVRPEGLLAKNVVDERFLGRAPRGRKKVEEPDGESDDDEHDGLDGGRPLKQQRFYPKERRRKKEEINREAVRKEGWKTVPRSRKGKK